MQASPKAGKHASVNANITKGDKTCNRHQQWENIQASPRAEKHASVVEGTKTFQRLQRRKNMQTLPPVENNRLKESTLRRVGKINVK